MTDEELQQAEFRDRAGMKAVRIADGELWKKRTGEYFDLIEEMSQSHLAPLPMYRRLAPPPPPQHQQPEHPNYQRQREGRLD